MAKRFATVLSSVIVLTGQMLLAPQSVAALPAPPPCFVGGPGYTCAGNVAFSAYTLSVPFRPFQAVAGTGQQPDIQVTFNHLVHNVRIFANDVDYPTAKMWVHLSGFGWIQVAALSGDNDPTMFSINSAGLSNSTSDGYDAVQMESGSGDYVDWRVEYQQVYAANGSYCKVTAAVTTCQNVTATVSQFVQGSIFDPFQAVPGTGQQPPIDITFQVPLARVDITALDPDFVGNMMQAFAADGTLLGTVNFDGDNHGGTTNWSTKSIAVAGISRIRLTSAANDYTVFQGLTVWPMGPPPLNVSINGPGSVSAKGTYTFSASYQGFNPNPSFAWSERFCADSGCTSWTSIGTSPSFNRVLGPDCSGTGNNTYQVELLMTNSDGRTATADNTTYLCQLP